MSRRAKVAVGALLLAVSSVGVVAAVNARPERNGDTGADEVAQTSLETLTATRRTLVESESIDGTIGHGTPTPLPIEAQGTVTWAPEQDDVLAPGDVAVRIDERPVVLVAGDVPLYRELRRVSGTERDEAGDKLGEQSGPDVQQLQEYLIGLGFDDEGRLEADGVFGKVTENAVEDWQRWFGHPATGRIDRNQIVFVPSEVRVQEAPIVGQPFTPISVTTPSRTVSARATPNQRSFFVEGTAVEIDVDGAEFSGTVTEATRTTGPDGTTTYELEISVDGDVPDTASSVELTAVRTVANDVVTVPVRALLALAEGGWAVEVPTDAGSQLVPVDVGEIVDGIAEVTGIDHNTAVLVPA